MNRLVVCGLAVGVVIGAPLFDFRPTLAASPATTKIKVLMNWFAQVDQSGYWRAQLDGLGRKHGLAINVLQGGPKIQTIPQVAAGQAQFGIANADDVLLARLQGAPIKAVFVSLNYVPYSLVYHRGAGIKTIHDLSGKTVAVTLGAAYWQWLKMRYHITGTRDIPVSGDLTAFRNSPDMVQQGYSIILPARMRAAGLSVRQFIVAKLGYRPYDVLFTTDDMIAHHRAEVKNALAAFKQGWINFIKGPDTTKAEILKDNPLISPKIHDQAVAIMKRDLLPHTMSKVGCMVKSRWDELATQLKQVKFLPPSFDPSQAYDLHLTPGC